MFSLFDYPVLATGAISGLAYVLIHYLRSDMARHLRWLWNEVQGFVLCIVMPLAGLSLMLWLLSGHSWSHTAFKYIACIVTVVTGLLVLFMGGTKGRK